MLLLANKIWPKFLGAVSPSNFSEYKKNQIKYLGLFIFSGSPLNSEEYSENILDAETLQEFVKSISKEQRLKLASPCKAGGGMRGDPPLASPPGGGGGGKENLSKTRVANTLKASKRVKLINIKTNEILLFDSRGETARYLQELNTDFKCSAGTVSDG